MKDTLARISHSIWELRRQLKKNPDDAELRKDFIKFYFESRLYVEQRNGVPGGDRSFLLLQEREAPLCILFHGAGGSPDEMRGLGEHLFGRGYTVYANYLPLSKSTGDSYELGSVRHKLHKRKTGNKRAGILRGENQWSICMSETEVMLDALLCYTPNTYLVGFSFGGTIALHIINKYPVRGAILIAPALYAVKSGRYLVFQVMRKFMPTVASNVAPREYTILEFMEMTIRNLNPIKKPVLVIQSSRDPLVSTKGFYLLKRHLDNTKSRLVLIDSDTHVLVNSAESKKVFGLSSDFLKKI